MFFSIRVGSKSINPLSNFGRPVYQCIHYHKQYLINVIKSLKDKENDYISNMYLCKEAISIYLTLQSEYQYLYSNKIKNCNGPYDIGESKTLNLFKSKENTFYATYIF